MSGLDRYFELLAREAQADMAVFHTWWVVYTVAPLSLYCAYAILKWYVLLMPITLPMTLLLAGRAGNSKKSASDYRTN